MSDLHEIITIDGPAGAGKTTVARRLARKLGYAMVESGSLYRTFTWLLLSKRPDLFPPRDESEVLQVLEEEIPKLEVKADSQGLKVFYQGLELSQELRKPEVEARVSEVAALAGVRKLANQILQILAEKGPIVAEGRDMGSVVFPQAKAKFFLTADPYIRAERRYLEWQAKGLSASKEEVLSKIKERDQKDSSRKEAPLRVPEGAIIIDTTALSPEEVVNQMLEALKGYRP